ncbi:MAG TPA: 50S ribosomal protein L3 [Bacillota bacterium]|nr:50S ribosomal protein L3 [Bacillota bacterium]HPE37898.1 50S ribosomal protein L3 [Bacillota bacterium]
MTKFVLGKKAGMTQLFDENGIAIPATVIECEPMLVIQNKTVENDGYKAVKVAIGDIREKLVNKPDKGQFAAANVPAKRTIREFKTEDDFSIAQEIKVSEMFNVGDHVDVSGVSKGKGFAGNIKRHGQKGGPGGHGSMYHRRVGSMGANTTPARVIKGKKMPGHMGVDHCTVQNLSVVLVDGERGILVLKGAVPGPKGGVLSIKSSVKAK